MMKTIFLFLLLFTLQATAISHVSDIGLYKIETWTPHRISDYTGNYGSLEEDGTAYNRAVITFYGDTIKGVNIERISLCRIIVPDVFEKPKYEIIQDIQIKKGRLFAEGKLSGDLFVKLVHKKTGKTYKALKYGDQYLIKLNES